MRRLERSVRTESILVGFGVGTESALAFSSFAWARMKALETNARAVEMTFFLLFLLLCYFSVFWMFLAPPPHQIKFNATYPVRLFSVGGGNDRTNAKQDEERLIKNKGRSDQ